jgi:3',5'-cyclic AMP phosphodiesterase CpdA
MPRIVITSDLHLGITPEDVIRALVAQVAAEQPDLTVLAGDLGERIDNFVRCLGLFAGLHGQVGVLAGNHDVWSRRGHGSQALFERELPQASREVGFLWLEDTVWSRDGVAVVGSLAWYDYSAADPELQPRPPEWYAANKGRYNMDAHLIDWPWTDGAVAQRLADGITERLVAIEGDPAIQAAVVVTHVPLVEAQISRKPGNARWGISNAYFGNLATGARVLAFPKVAAIVSGHTHVGRDATIPRPVAGGGYASLRVSVVPSDYGAPAYVVVDTRDDHVEMRTVPPAASATERASGSVRRAYGIARRTMEIVRKRLWPE